MQKPPHLTPRSLVGQRFAPDIFGGIRIALVGYCPPPSILERYAPERVGDQHFIHVSPDSVRILSHGGRRFLSLCHVYGGTVSSTTIEELAYYGIDAVLAYGLAGSLGTKGVKMGDVYVVDSGFVADGTTPHYSAERVVLPDAGLVAEIAATWPDAIGAQITPVRAATNDAIYREDEVTLERFRREGCDIVNADSTHLYAVARTNSENRVLRAVQCGVISDVVSTTLGREAESTLSEMLAAPGDGFNPLERTGDIVRFYIESLAPRL